MLRYPVLKSVRANYWTERSKRWLSNLGDTMNTHSVLLLITVWLWAQLLTEEEHLRFLDLRLNIAESRLEHSFHCQTPNCQGWCVYEDEVNEFYCELCGETNCILCRVLSWHPLDKLIRDVLVFRNSCSARYKGSRVCCRRSIMVWIARTTRMTCASEPRTTRQLSKLNKCWRWANTGSAA